MREIRRQRKSVGARRLDGGKPSAAICIASEILAICVMPLTAVLIFGCCALMPVGYGYDEPYSSSWQQREPAQSSAQPIKEQTTAPPAQFNQTQIQTQIVRVGAGNQSASIATEFERCGSMDYSYQRESCFAMVALEYESPAACDRVGGSSCYQQLAIKYNKIGYCRLGGMDYDCINNR